MVTDVISSSNLKSSPVLDNFHLTITNKLFCNDKDTGLKAIIGIHNTVLGPALGGTRMWSYQTEWDARMMCYGFRGDDLQIGYYRPKPRGGKAVIIGDAKSQKTPN